MKTARPLVQLYTLARDGDEIVIRRHAVLSNRTFGDPVEVARVGSVAEAMKALPRRAHRLDNRFGPATDDPSVLGCFLDDSPAPDREVPR
ncbi:hypothetical protein AB1L88_15480 [Tautonia sp. JC769]|uniref:hypothetical protein n=1 Tax=Tautonia sp. JC769 TaxID=3232135 RepID=UPI0034597FD3